MSHAALHLYQSSDSGRGRECRDSRRAGAQFLAGGTTLYDLMKLNIERPTHLVDVTGLEDLNGIDTERS